VQTNFKSTSTHCYPATSIGSVPAEQSTVFASSEQEKSFFSQNRRRLRRWSNGCLCRPWALLQTRRFSCLSRRVLSRDSGTTSSSSAFDERSSCGTFIAYGQYFSNPTVFKAKSAQVPRSKASSSAARITRDAAEGIGVHHLRSDATVTHYFSWVCIQMGWIHLHITLS